MSESKETKRFCAELTAAGAMVFATVGGVKGGGIVMQDTGWPDRFVQSRWWCGWIEFKAGSNRLSSKQKHIGGELERRAEPGNLNYFVVRFRPDGDINIEDSHGDVLKATPARGAAFLTELRVLGMANR